MIIVLVNYWWNTSWWSFSTSIRGCQHWYPLCTRQWFIPDVEYNTMETWNVAQRLMVSAFLRRARVRSACGKWKCLVSWSTSCPRWAGWGWVRVGSRGWRCLHRGSSESRDALRNILWPGCNGCPTFLARTVYTGRASCREFWEEGGTDRAGYVPKIRDNERKRQKERWTENWKK